MALDRNENQPEAGGGGRGGWNHGEWVWQKCEPPTETEPPPETCEAVRQARSSSFSFLSSFLPLLLTGQPCQSLCQGSLGNVATCNIDRRKTGNGFECKQPNDHHSLTHTHTYTLIHGGFSFTKGP